MKKLTTILLTGSLIAGLLTGCGKTLADVGTVSSSNPAESTVESSLESQTSAKEEPATSFTAPKNAIRIILSDEGSTVDGKSISTDSASRVYAANDIVFYLEGQGFTYGEGTEDDEHSQAEADAHTVIHITQPGDYVLEGSLSAGQIAIDLGDDAESDPEAVVNLYLNGADITCSVAPGVIFYNVYECGSTDTETATHEVDTTKAGANVFICDDTTNTINGSYVARIYKSYELSDDGTEVIDNKKLHKYDAAFYSKRSLNINGGTGILNINAENEGLDSELHLTINGGNINITSGNDGINTNEDGVSVTTINGGNLNILVAGTTGEGDGIDSNGWLVINGGTVTAAACSNSGDAGIDSDMGIHVNGGTIAASGNMYDRLEDGSQNYAVFSFASRQKGGTTYTLKNEKEQIVKEWAPVNDYTYLVISAPDLQAGTYTLWCGADQMTASSGSGMGGFGGPGNMDIPAGNFGEGEMPQMPEGMEWPKGERPELPEGMERPEGARPEIPDGTEHPEGMERPQMPQGEIPEGDFGGNFQGGNGQRPVGGHGHGGFGNDFDGESSTDFTINQGGNFFNRIMIVTTEV